MIIKSFLLFQTVLAGSILIFARFASPHRRYARGLVTSLLAAYMVSVMIGLLAVAGLCLFSSCMVFVLHCNGVLEELNHAAFIVPVTQMCLEVVFISAFSRITKYCEKKGYTCYPVYPLCQI